MSQLQPFYVFNSAGNAVVPFDQVTGKLWTTATDKGGGSGAWWVAGARITATISGLTMLSDLISCYSNCAAHGQSGSLRNTAIPDQNQTACLDAFGRVGCSQLLIGVPANPIAYNTYANNGCTGSATPRSVDWRARAYDYDPDFGMFQFSILWTPSQVCGDPTLAVFVAFSNSLCFPLTLSNLLTAGAAGSDQNLGAFGTVKRFGYGGTVTLSLGECLCS